mgnify:FL=1
MMQNLVPSAIADNKDGMTSLEIAEVTGKQHAHVMRDVRNLIGQGVNQSNFGLVKYKDKKGEMRDMYSLTPKGCLILASGYDALLRERIIDRLETLEKSAKAQLPSTYLDALKALVASEEEKQMLAADNAKKQQTIEMKDAQIVELDTAVNNMKPKVSYVDNILQCKDTINVTQIAQDYGMSAKAFNVLLRNLKIQHKVGQIWIVYGKYLAKGYVQSETFTYAKADGTQGVRTFTKWSQRGRLFLYDTLKSHNIIPLIEKTSNSNDNEQR